MKRWLAPHDDNTAIFFLSRERRPRGGRLDISCVFAFMLAVLRGGFRRRQHLREVVVVLHVVKKAIAFLTEVTKADYGAAAV